MTDLLQGATFWWVAAGLFVAAELATGTFYLLMMALGLAAAAIAAHLGLGFAAQLACAAVVGGGAVAIWHRLRERRGDRPPVEANPDVNIDVGQRVHVTHWAKDGTARVNYRGASWAARWAGEGTPQPGDHVIRAVQGSELMLGR